MKALGAMRGRRSAIAVSMAALLLALSPFALPGAVSWAFIPRADRVAGASARENVDAARNQALQLELVLRIGDGEPVGRGELVTHPQGLARLELRGASGLVERHVLQGNDHRASRNGHLLESARAFLPPLFLLQSDSAETLRAALRSFGVPIDEIRLAPCGDSDCFVIGEPAANPEPAEGRESSRIPLRPAVGESSSLRITEGPQSRIWVDTNTYQIIGLDIVGFAKVRLGPAIQFEHVRFPEWIEIEEAERAPARFEIENATPVNAPAPAFGNSWLMGSGSATGSDGSPGAGDAADSGGSPLR